MSMKKHSTGQAMTEFVVAATFVLVPMLLIYPLLGKYIDMKHSTVEDLRYIALERTVLYVQIPLYWVAPIKK